MIREELAMSLASNQEDVSTVIRLDGAIDISGAADLKTALLEALQPGRTIELGLDCVSGMDVTAVQLLWAAQREAKALGANFRFIGQVPEAVSAYLAEAGFRDFLSAISIG